MSKDVKIFDFDVKWDPSRQQYQGTCRQFPDEKVWASTYTEAFLAISQLIEAKLVKDEDPEELTLAEKKFEENLDKLLDELESPEEFLHQFNTLVNKLQAFASNATKQEELDKFHRADKLDPSKETKH